MITRPFVPPNSSSSSHDPFVVAGLDSVVVANVGDAVDNGATGGNGGATGGNGGGTGGNGGATGGNGGGTVDNVDVAVGIDGAVDDEEPFVNVKGGVTDGTCGPGAIYCQCPGHMPALGSGFPGPPLNHG